MIEYRRKLQNSDGKNCLWANTLTSKSLTRMGESMAKQTTEQKESYTYQVDESNGSILVKRLDQKGTYCHNCKTEEVMDEIDDQNSNPKSQKEICYSCCQGSPIPTFSRVREISFSSTPSGKYVMSCDCADNDGFPCRHVASLLRMKPDHFAPRWHKEYCHYGESDFPKDRSKYFSEKLKDQRLLVTYSEMLQAQLIAKEYQSDQDLSDLPRSQCFQRNKLQVFQEENSDDLVNNTGLEVEVGMSQDSEYNYVPDCDSDSDTHQVQPLLTGSYNHYCVSIITQVEHFTKGHKDLQDKSLAELLEWKAKYMTLSAQANPNVGERKRQRNSQIVDLFHGKDRRKKCVRLKSSSEPRRR